MAERLQLTGLPLVLLAGERDTQWLERLLDAGGYAVLRERTGRHALQRARATQPDAIIVEGELSDMTGVELCSSLRSDPGVASSTPMLLCVAATTREVRIAALRAGAWECVAPPHDADEILLKLDAFVHAKLDADRARAEGLLDPATGLYNRQGLARRARELGAQAFREHGALACVVLALDRDPGDPSGMANAPPAVVARTVQALKNAARVSDVIGRLTPAEFAVLAPDTDPAGARRLAERLGTSLEAALAVEPAVPETASGTSLTSRPPRVRCGYEAIANVGYAPIEPVDLLVRAATALRTGRAEAIGWIRRFEPFAEPPTS
jgi:PleD family two-component response regulator